MRRVALLLALMLAAGRPGQAEPKYPHAGYRVELNQRLAQFELSQKELFRLNARKAALESPSSEEPSRWEKLLDLFSHRRRDALAAEHDEILTQSRQLEESQAQAALNIWTMSAAAWGLNQDPEGPILNGPARGRPLSMDIQYSDDFPAGLGGSPEAFKRAYAVTMDDGRTFVRPDALVLRDKEGQPLRPMSIGVIGSLVKHEQFHRRELAAPGINLFPTAPNDRARMELHASLDQLGWADFFGLSAEFKEGIKADIHRFMEASRRVDLLERGAVEAADRDDYEYLRGFGERLFKEAAERWKARMGEELAPVPQTLSQPPDPGEDEEEDEPAVEETVEEAYARLKEAALMACSDPRAFRDWYQVHPIGRFALDKEPELRQTGTDDAEVEEGCAWSVFEDLLGGWRKPGELLVRESQRLGAEAREKAARRAKLTPQELERIRRAERETQKDLDDIADYQEKRGRMERAAPGGTVGEQPSRAKGQLQNGGFAP